jgi:pimeloyl-ACP methyl ester carboxylesterase
MLDFTSPCHTQENRVTPHRLLSKAGKTRLSGRFLPASERGTTPLVGLHGISRNARALWEAFAPGAQASGRALLVPRFDAANWPLFQRISKARPDLALLDLIQHSGLTGQRLDLFGFSGSAQLAHRFAMLYPHRVACLHLAAPGWYCLPDLQEPWPRGLCHEARPGLRKFDVAALSRSQLASYLALPVRIWVGADDVARDASLRQSADIDVTQGHTRLDRAFTYATAFAHGAKTRGIPRTSR